MRKKLFLIGLSLLLISLFFNYYLNRGYVFSGVMVILIIIGFSNTHQKKHTILRNFPVLGYFRYLFEMIAPEIQQYFIERTTDGKPFSRNQRSLVYQRAKNIDSNTPFGTQLNINTIDYEGIKHSIFPAKVNDELPRVMVGGPSLHPTLFSIFI